MCRLGCENCPTDGKHPFMRAVRAFCEAKSSNYRACDNEQKQTDGQYPLTLH